MSDSILGVEHIVDCDADPIVPVYWQVKRGSYRIAILIPKLRLVLKLPVVRLAMVKKEVVAYTRLGKEKKLWRFLFGPVDREFSLLWCLCGGIKSNWSEYVFWRKTRNTFLWPTRSSFFGLVNIQVLGRKCPLSDQVWVTLHEATNGDVWKDCHCFANSENFTVTRKGKLRLLDYGSKGTQEVVLKHGHALAKLSGLPTG